MLIKNVLYFYIQNIVHFFNLVNGHQYAVAARDGHR